MAAFAGARFPLWAAVAALPRALTMRDTFDGYSSLDVSQDESGASMGNDLCCCKDGAQTSEQCSLVSIEHQQYIMAKGNGESKWTCPNGYVMASQTRFTNPPTCSGSKKKHWEPDWMYEPSLEALRVSSTVYVRDPFAGVTSDSNPYDLEEGVKGKVVGVNKDGTFNVEFPDVGVVVLNTDKLSNLCRNPPTSVETEGTDGGEGAKLKAKSFLKDAMEAQVSVFGAGNVLGQLQAAIIECELAGIEAATDRDLFEAYERRRSLFGETQVEAHGSTAGATSSASGPSPEDRTEVDAAKRNLKQWMEQKETPEIQLNGGLDAILLHQLPPAILRCWRAGLDPKQGKRAPLVTRAEEKLKTLEVEGVKGSDKLKAMRRQFDDSKTVRWADLEAQTNQ